MPIPAPPEGRPGAAAEVLALFRQLHEEIRAEIGDLDDDGLNWVPGAECNSIATIVTHVLGSEAETLRAVAGAAGERQRDSEFAGARRSSAAVLDELASADRLLAELGPRIDGPRLRVRCALPTLPPAEQRSGLTWLVGNYGHAREHLGHLQLTRQLYLAGGRGREAHTGGPGRVA